MFCFLFYFTLQRHTQAVQCVLNLKNTIKMYQCCRIVDAVPRKWTCINNCVWVCMFVAALATQVV